MSIIAWEPFREINRLLSGFPMPLEHIHPAIDIKETAKNFSVEVNLPGVKEENIRVCATPTSLEISAHQEEKTKKEKKDYIYRERHD